MDDLSSELGKVRNWGFSKLQRRGWGGENKGDVYDRVEWKTNDGASGWERVEGLLITVYLSEAGVNKEMNLRKGGSVTSVQLTEMQPQHSSVQCCLCGVCTFS